MRGRARLLALVPLLLALAPARLPAQAGRFGETTSVVVVEVPVQVVKDGKPVRGLTAENFEVWDGKTKQRLTGFEAIDLAALEARGAAAGAPPPALPPAARRHFLFLFDLTFARPKSILQAREAAQDLVRDGLHASDLAAVATYSASRGSELVLGFTADRAQLEAAIESLGLPQLVPQSPDPLRLVIAGLEADMGLGAPGLGGGAGTGMGRRSEGREDFLEVLKRAQREMEASQRHTLEDQVSAASRSLADLAQVMGAVDGRKFVVYLSEGFQASAATGTGSDADSANAVASGESWKVDSEKLYGSARVQAALAAMFESFRRADCIVQAVDIGGVRTAGSEAATEHRPDADVADTGRDALLALAHYTGGELYQNFNDLGAAMGKMLDRTSVTYLLSFQPEGLLANGAFHNLEVRLKGAPRGARVHHRAGYFAPDPLRAVHPLEQRLLAAADILGGEEGGTLPVSALAVPLPGGGAAQAAVPLLLEIDGPALLEGHVGRSLALEIYAYALDREQAVRGFLTQRVDLDLEKVEPQLRAGGLKFYGELALPPGAYTLRLLVRNAQSGARRLASLPVEVPAAVAEAGAGPLVSPPLFLASGGSWVVTRQAERAGEPARQYPFTLAGQPFVPDVRPVVAAAGEARVALLAYNLGSGDVVARAEVLRAGDRQPAGGGGFRLLDRQRGEGGAPDRLVGVLTARGLPPGEYLLRVTVTDRASGATHSSGSPFVVKG
ncbi:MAG TPA: VWA domain-containing protein [Thermoanaerobaculia bacterium]|nr:VWA domain-containing protein [Thermoanaerobaculia bacterium]